MDRKAVAVKVFMFLVDVSIRVLGMYLFVSGMDLRLIGGLMSKF